MSHTSSGIDQSLAEAAATWFVRLKEGTADPRRQAEFQRWLNASERHGQEFARFQRLWGALEDPRPRGRRLGARSTVVALLAVALGLAWRLPLVDLEQTTPVGTQAHLVLADGSAIDLDGQTTLRVEQSLLKRRLTVVKGQVFIRVAPDWRPLVVTAGRGEIRDIGTAFNVAQEDGQTTVTVAEGRVDIRLPGAPEALPLAAGQRLSYTATAHTEPRTVPPASANLWASGHWQFDDVSLNEVVAQINRHHAKPVRLVSPALGNYRVSGLFEATNREGLLQAITYLHPLRLEETAGESRLKPR